MRTVSLNRRMRAGALVMSWTKTYCCCHLLSARNDISRSTTRDAVT